jgi:hypothetical protein
MADMALKFGKKMSSKDRVIKLLKICNDMMKISRADGSDLEKYKKAKPFIEQQQRYVFTRFLDKLAKFLDQIN